MLSLYATSFTKIFLLIVVPFFVTGQTITTPQASPASQVSQTVGIAKVTVVYSRPSVKGREVWGNIVPYGWNKQGFGNNKEAPWRAGANENTTISFTHDATVEGKPVKAGTYGLFFVINENNTGEVILSKDNRYWGSYFYEAENDALRAPIKINDASHTELLTYGFTSVSKNEATLALNWEKKQFPVKIAFDMDAIVLKNADEELKGAVGFTWQGLLSAAQYTLQSKAGLEQGLQWANMAVAQNNSFATLSVKSGILNELGSNDEADKVMNDALAMATEAELNIYGYQFLNNGQNDKAIEILTLNTKRFPKSANAWDSLGEAYFIKGDKKNAILSFKKSLSLNPADNVKLNSEKYLKQMNAL
jgi:tetratricopeptide (TPR) repeat protein